MKGASVSDSFAAPTVLQKTPLHAWHAAHGARLVPFAGWDMPVQYAGGIIAEVKACRTGAVLFDVSHMALVRLEAAAGVDIDLALERLVPADVVGLAPGKARLTVFPDANGGVLDDLMVTKPARGTHRLLVVNAGRAAHDLAHLKAQLEPAVRVTHLADQALIAVQGPAAVAIVETLIPGVAALPFMGHAELALDGTPVQVWRSGYTGEDGAEIALPAALAVAFADRLLAAGVQPAGLGARDALRLEAGLCLYGHELSPEISPIEAQLAWTIGKRRRSGGAAAGGFPGAARILAEIDGGAPRRRVGLRPEGRAIARENTPVLDAAGAQIGIVTSGGWSPTLDGPIAMAYVPAAFSAPGTVLAVSVRGKAIPAVVTALPFVPTRYAK
jgi:aminomethyltransferase